MTSIGIISYLMLYTNDSNNLFGKQAMKRRGKDLGIPQELLRALIGSEFHNVKGLIDLLTVIDPDDIRDYGIPYIRAEMEKDGPIASLTTFWKYFDKTYLKRFGTDTFNIYRLTQDASAEETLIARTNNGLERFNRKLGELFHYAHPNMRQFVHVIREVSQEYVDLLAQIRRGRATAPKHLPVRKYQIPIQYEQYCIAMNHPKYIVEKPKKAKKYPRTID